VNSPPQRTKGRVPNEQDKIQLYTTIASASLFEIFPTSPGTNRMGNIPKSIAIKQVYSSGKKAVSEFNPEMTAAISKKAAFKNNVNAT
jgi:hypothetical protein